LFGAAGFGFVIGWLTYFSNRWRKGEVSFADLATLIGIIGGGAVLGLFPAASDLFGAYGIGLFLGFFSYFIFMLIFVNNSRPEFNWTWFLDGRSRKPDYNYFFPGGMQNPMEGRGMGVGQGSGQGGPPAPRNQPPGGEDVA
jgi:hypothetical protein